jgi:lipoprotein-anchoring transpeptidase ErfK/SrfK
MKTNMIPPALVVSCMLLWAAAIPAQAQHRHAAKRPAPPPVDAQALKTQVMLDRAGYSPGEIDAAMGTSTQRALDAFTKHGGDGAALPSDALTTYRITDQDAAGPFTPEIPSDMMEMARLDALNYKNIVEALGERFHCSPSLLRRLNPNVAFAAGGAIQVPNVADDTEQSTPATTIVTVSKNNSDLIVTDGAGRVLMYAPVTSGSEHDPLPIGEWKVTGVQHNPKFHYNPQLFWDAKAGDAKTTIQPGPNNPVGVVWIDVSREHYGLHGTPEPSTIGKTTSHGCVRLTNWDAAKLAGLVRPGTKVVFTE